jgi:hypothetical protein
MGLDVQSRTQNANEELLESNNDNKIEGEAAKEKGKIGATIASLVSGS